jgi:hypothetical protein
VTVVGTGRLTILMDRLARLVGVRAVTTGAIYWGASARAWRQKRSMTDIQYAVYPFRPRSDNGRSGVPGAIVLERVAGC